MEADSCSTENIIDEHKFEKVQSVVVEKIFLQPTHTQLYVFAQKEPIPLVACFEAEIEDVSTGKKAMARFLVVRGITKSPPLLSLDKARSIACGECHQRRSSKARRNFYW